MIIPDLHNLHRTQLTRKCFSRLYPEYYDYLLNKYPECDWKEGWYLEINNLQEAPRCPVCGSKVPFISMHKGYRKYCSQECGYKDPERTNLIESTMLNRYGVTHALQSQESKTKAQNTMLERYGNPKYNNREKYRKTCEERYGGVGSESEVIKDKVLRTWHNNRLKQHTITDQVGYTVEGEWIMRCDRGCEGCDGTYIIESGHYFDRKRLGLEICTKLNPVSQNKISDTHLEKFIKDILDQYNIKYITNDRTIISPKEVDIYIPSHHIAIECNGVFWHSMKDDNYHYDKWKSCKDKGIQLLTIWQDWIYLKPNIVKSILLTKLGLIEGSIGARKCVIKAVSTKDSNKFLNDNHIQGQCKNGVRLGLYYKDELVSLMCFTKSPRSNEWELSRFCNKLYTRVNGAAGKLLSYFISNYNPGPITSFSSNDISDGGLYKTLGFEETGKSSSYWYIEVNTYKRYHRSLFSKTMLKKKGLYKEGYTERELMRELPYYRIQDSGITKWQLR